MRKCSLEIFASSPAPRSSTNFFAAYNRAPQISIKKSTPGNVQLDLTTGDRTDAVLQGTTKLVNSAWTDLQTYGPGLGLGFGQTEIVPMQSKQFFRMVAH